MKQTSSSKHLFMVGIKEALPLALSVSTSGLVFGLLGKQIGMTMLELTLMSALVFAGAAQFAALPLIASNFDPFSIALTTYIINLRYYLIAASLLPYWWGKKTKDNAIRAFFLTDEAYALTISRYEKGFNSTSYYWGAALSIYFGWVVATILGVLGGKLIPDPTRFGLDFAFPAAFLGLIIPQLKSGDKVAVALVSAILSILGSIYLPGKWYIILAGLAASSLSFFFFRGEKSNE